ncbi:MAG: putative cystathionine beta-synthase [Candidatus Heimdallarchaeota archaeon LC_3]|nr:MAG: putative cystathionine beta-synthase [Candidatus Heimdallarchaeota archaeon LC_3]
MDKNLQMRVYDSVIDAIGWTPIIKMKQIFSDNNVYLKSEFLNPGGSIKDRVGVYMLQEAEKQGIITPGQYIIEPSSGNTGVGLALMCALRGYKLIITMPDKMSKEKIQGLKAFGAEVIICPTAIEPEDPRSYYRMAETIAKEKNGWVPNQYFNQDNPQAHYLTTGPEIWEQTEGKVTHFVCSVGTGGTITGVGRYLKEENPNVQIIGADAVGSILKEAHEHPEHKYNPANVSTYLTEGIGEDFIPDTLDMDVVDKFYTVTDEEAFLTTREVVRKEGLLIGGSGGAAVHVVKQISKNLKNDDVVVVITPDGSQKYYSKIFNDDWMKEKGFLH